MWSTLSNASLTPTSIVQGVVEGIDAFRELSRQGGKSFDYSKADISGIKKIDNYTLSVKFAVESPLNLFPFAFAGMSIVPHEAIEKYGEEFAKNPVGTGPFSLKSYSRRGTTVLQKNPKYWGKFPTEGSSEEDKAIIAQAGGKSLPFVDEVHLPLIEEPQPAMLKFRKGEMHWVAMNKDDLYVVIDHKPGTRIFTLKPEMKQDFEFYQAPMLANNFIRFGMRDPIVGKNKALRQAIALAIDVPGYIDLLLAGRGTPSDALVPFEIMGSSRETGAKWYTQDIEAAKKKMMEAGFPGGKGLPPITIEYRAATKDMRQAFEYMRNDLAKIGITVVGNFQNFSSWLVKTDSGNSQVSDAGWNADYPDPDDFYALLYSQNKAPLPNNGNYENPKYDEIYLKARTLPNGPERYKLYAELSEIIKEDVPVILEYDQLAMGLLQKNVRNFKRNMLDDYPYKYFDIKE